MQVVLSRRLQISHRIVRITEEQVRLALRKEEANDEREEREALAAADEADNEESGEDGEQSSTGSKRRKTGGRGKNRKKKKRIIPRDARVSMAGFLILGLQVEEGQ